MLVNLYDAVTKAGYVCDDLEMQIKDQVIDLAQYDIIPVYTTLCASDRIEWYGRQKWNSLIIPRRETIASVFCVHRRKRI